MKEILTLQGGYPRLMDFVLDLQSEMLTLGNGLLSALAVDLVLAGCAVTDNGNGTVDIASGLVYINGEALRFDGASNVLANSTKAFSKGAYTTSDSKLFGDGSTKDVYREAKAVITNAAGTIAEVKIKTVLYTFKQYIQDCVNASEKKGTVKELYDMDGTLLQNFDTTGLGVTPAWLGWAIDNGNNGTPGSIGMATIAAGTYTDPNDGEQTVYTAGTPVGDRKKKLVNGEAPTPAGLVTNVWGPVPKPGDGGGPQVRYITGLSVAAPATVAANRMQPSMPLYRFVKIV